MTQTFRDHGEEIAFHLAQREAERAQADGITPPTAQDLADYDEYLDNLPKRTDADVEAFRRELDREDEDVESPPWPQSALDGDGFPY